MTIKTFRLSRLSLKVKFVLFFACVVMLICASGFFFYVKTSDQMEKELARRSVSMAENLALNPNLKLGLVNEDPKLIDGILNTAVKQKDVLYVGIQSVDASFSSIQLGDDAEPFLVYYKRNLAISQSLHLNAAVKQTLSSGKRFLSVRVPVLRGRMHTSSPESFLLMPGQGGYDQTDKKDDSAARAAARANDEQERLGYIDVGFSFESIEQGMRWVGWWSASLITLIVVVFLAFLLVVLRSVIRPIEAIAIRATLIAEGNLSQQVSVKSNDEIGKLAFNFNLMASRLSENIRAKDEYSDQLAIVNSQLEVANQELQKHFEQVLAGKREWETTFNAMSDAVFIFDHDHGLRLVNIAGRNLGNSWSDMLCEESCCLIHQSSGSEQIGNQAIDCSNCALEQVFSSGCEYSFERLDTKTNKMFLTTVSPIPNAPGVSAGVIAIMRDITEEKNLRVQLLQSEKMSAIGQLVSGVAHELNNPLNAVIGYSQLCLDSPLFDKELTTLLDCVVREGMRARKIVQNLLTVSRQHKPEKKYVNINDIIRPNAGAAHL